MEFWRWNQPQTVSLNKIEAGIDVRTTIMLRNIRDRVDFEDLKSFLDETSESHYDFSYLRIDFSNKLNVGYAFVNFVRPEFIINLIQRRVGQEWNMYGFLKKCEVLYATIQGIDCLLASSVSLLLWKRSTVTAPSFDTTLTRPSACSPTAAT
jgi:hypothetical protein